MNPAEIAILALGGLIFLIICVGMSNAIDNLRIKMDLMKAEFTTEIEHLKNKLAVLNKEDSDE